MKKLTHTDMQSGEIMDGPMMRTAYNYDRDAASRKAALYCKDPTRTQQQFKDETNINNIMKKYGVTGELPLLQRPPLPEDYEDITDFQSAMNVIRRAQEAFNQMPSGIRARFQNNPHIFAQFFNDPENHAEAVKMGLVIVRPKEPEKEPAKAPGGDQGDKKGVT